MLVTAFVAHDQPSAVVHPAKAPFHLPALAVTRPHGKWSAALRSLPVAAALHIHPDRQALAIRNHHRFRALADCGLPDAGAPFWAGTKLPSQNACARSSLPWASSRRNNIRPQVPSWDQAWKRRQHVAGELTFELKKRGERLAGRGNGRCG